MVTDLDDYSLARVIKGIYGTTYKTIGTDEDGNILIIIKDPTSDNYVAIDSDGYITSVMKGNDGGDLVTIAVDSEGNIVSLMKGDYAGTLTTLAVDAQGRIKAVLSDPEDVFGNPNYMGAAELAARLGALSKHHRLGNLLWQDDFQGSLNHWQVTEGAGGGAAALNSTYALQGDQAMKMQSGTTTDDPTKIARSLSYSVKSKIGFETAFTYHAQIKDLTWRITMYDGTDLHVAKISWNNGLDRWFYWDADNNPQTLQLSRSLTNDAGAFNIVKLVVDFPNKTLWKLIDRDQEYDKSDLIYYSTPSPGTAPRIKVEFWVDGNTGQNAIVYVDNVIITQNEP